MALQMIGGELLVANGALTEDVDCCTCTCDPTACTVDLCAAPPFGCCCDPCLTPAALYADTPPQISIEVTGVEIIGACCEWEPVAPDFEFGWANGPGGTTNISAVLSQVSGFPCVYEGSVATAVEIKFYSDAGCAVLEQTFGGNFSIQYTTGDPGHLFIWFSTLFFDVFCNTLACGSEGGTGCPILPQTIENGQQPICEQDGGCCGSSNPPLFTGGTAVLDVEC